MEQHLEGTQPTPVQSIPTRPAKPFRARKVHAGAHETGRSQSKIVWAGIIVVALLFVPIALLVGAYAWMRLGQAIAPGVKAGGIPLGGMNLIEAAAMIDQSWNQELVMTAVDTGDAGRIWTVRPSELGLSIDAQKTAENAYSFARVGSLPTSISDMVNAFSNGWELKPIVEFDHHAARAGLESLYESAFIPAEDAQLGLQAGEVNATPAQWGRQLDIDSSIELIAADPEAVLLRYGFVPLVTSSVRPKVEQVADAVDEADRLLSSNPILRAYDPVIDEWLEFRPSREEASTWLRIQNSGTKIDVHLDEEAVEGYVAGLQATLGEERFLELGTATEALLSGLRGEEIPSLRIKYLPRYHVVAPEDTLVSISFKVGIPYWQWLEANPEVKARGLRLGESITIPPRDAMLELPIVEGKRIVVSILEQRMWIMEEGETIEEHVISTGIPNSPTMPGIFQVKSHYVNAYASNWDLYMPHFLGIYNATPNLQNGIHGLPRLSNGVRLWEGVLGSPASYGCVVLDLEAAEHLFTWAEDGVIVEIRA